VGRYPKDVPQPNGGEGFTGNLNVAELPINFVTFDQARAACRKLGGDLPTEAEWEYVATGLGRGNLFVWGDDPPSCGDAFLALVQPFGECARNLPSLDGGTSGGSGALAVLNAIRLLADRGRDYSDVPALDGGAARVNNLEGIFSEWTADLFMEYDDSQCWGRDGMLTHPICDLPAGAQPESSDGGAGTTLVRSARGGSIRTPLSLAYLAVRNRYEQDAKTATLGFRCVYPLAGSSDSPRVNIFKKVGTP
jgi:formylglycine-generating enzyme required for sulfatase activity